MRNHLGRVLRAIINPNNKQYPMKLKNATAVNTITVARGYPRKSHDTSSSNIICQTMQLRREKPKQLKTTSYDIFESGTNRGMRENSIQYPEEFSIVASWCFKKQGKSDSEGHLLFSSIGDCTMHYNLNQLMMAQQITQKAMEQNY